MHPVVVLGRPGANAAHRRHVIGFNAPGQGLGHQPFGNRLDELVLPAEQDPLQAIGTGGAIELGAVGQDGGGIHQLAGIAARQAPTAS